MWLHAGRVVIGGGSYRLVVAAVLNTEEFVDVKLVLNHVGDLLEPVESLLRAMQNQVLKDALDVIVQRLPGGAPDVIKFPLQVVKVNILHFARVTGTVRPRSGRLNARALGLGSLCFSCLLGGQLCCLRSLVLPVKDHAVESHPLDLVARTVLIVVERVVEAVEGLLDLLHSAVAD